MRQQNDGNNTAEHYSLVAWEHSGPSDGKQRGKPRGSKASNSAPAQTDLVVFAQSRVEFVRMDSLVQLLCDSVA